MKRLITSPKLQFPLRLLPLMAILIFISLESKSQVLNCNAHFTHQVAPGSNSIYFISGQNPTGTVYNWHFGDGTTGNGANIVHTYQPGNYWVCLTVVRPATPNSVACTATFCDSIHIGNTTVNCNANFTFQGGGSNNSVHFNNAANPSATIYTWSFGDGGTSNVANPTHTYAPGNYQVCLTVAIPSANGTILCTSTFCDSIHISPPNTLACNAHFTHQFSSSANGIYFTSPVNPAGATYSWTFGDGGTANTKNAFHSYAPGNYWACLTVTLPPTGTNPGCTSTYCDSIHVSPVTINCNAHFTKQPAPVVNSIYFVSPQNPPGTIYSWNFGDGGTSTNANVVHHYLPGHYLACLTVTVPATSPNTIACTSTYCDSIHIPQTINCNAHFTHTAASSVNGINFISQGNPAGTQYHWNFGDGGTANVPNPVHNFAPGNYQVCLTVTRFSTTSNLPLCTATFCDSIHIANVNNCTANFNYHHLSTPLTYAFTNQSSPNATRFFWHFGDATTSTSANPVHHYTTAGLRQVCLTMFDTVHHCSKTKCIMISASTMVENPLSALRGTEENTIELDTDELKVNVYPNPTADNAIVHIENAKTPVTFMLYDNTGKVMENKSKLTNGDFEIDNSNRAAGIYFYRIISEDNSTLNGKLIIQK